MYCQHCGAKNSDQAKFCCKCGANMNGEWSETNDRKDAPVYSTHTEYDGYQNYYEQDETDSYNIMSIVGCVISCVSLLLNLWGLVGLAGLIVSVIGLQQINQRNSKGKAAAITGIVIGAFSVFWAACSLACVASMFRY